LSRSNINITTAVNQAQVNDENDVVNLPAVIDNGDDINDDLLWYRLFGV